MVALVLTGAACDPVTRHHVLTIFFDGVPPIETAAQKPAAAAATVEARHFREHGPYGAKLCTGCHESMAGNTFVAPRDELCLHCHVMPAPKFEHDPAASGDCLSCHDPHSSAYRYLLVAEPDKVCAECHDASALPEDAPHTDPAQTCASCHDPHGSDKEHLLR